MFGPRTETRPGSVAEAIKWSFCLKSNELWANSDWVFADKALFSFK